MRYFIFMLWISLPYIGGARVAAPIPQGETAITQQAIPHGFAPKKHRFFERIAKNILQKRLKKALGRSDGEAGKSLSILGFTCSMLGVIMLFAGSAASLVLFLCGLLLSISGLALSSSATEKWVKGLAIAAIIPPVIVGLLLLTWLAASR